MSRQRGLPALGNAICYPNGLKERPENGIPLKMLCEKSSNLSLCFEALPLVCESSKSAAAASSRRGHAIHHHVRVLQCSVLAAPFDKLPGTVVPADDTGISWTHLHKKQTAYHSSTRLLARSDMTDLSVPTKPLPRDCMAYQRMRVSQSGNSHIDERTYRIDDDRPPGVAKGALRFHLFVIDDVPAAATTFAVSLVNRPVSHSKDARRRQDSVNIVTIRFVGGDNDVPDVVCLAVEKLVPDALDSALVAFGCRQAFIHRLAFACLAEVASADVHRDELETTLVLSRVF